MSVKPAENEKINAWDIRIGNWVINPNNNEWSKISAMDISDIENGYKNREPIPLTNDVLTKNCGFEVEYTVGGFLRWQKGRFKLLDRKLPYPIEQKRYILYLHQLQDIYMLIEGKELEVSI